MPIFADPVAARLLLEAIEHSRTTGTAYVLAYAILPDHMHLVAVPRSDASISDVLMNIKRYSARAINHHLSRKGPLWQQSFFDRAIRDEVHLATTVAYVHQNPVAAGLVQREQDYVFSSAHDGASVDLDAYLSE